MFNLLELPVLTAFLQFDPADLPESTSSEFREYGTQELGVLYDFDGNEYLKNRCVVHMMQWS